MQSDDTARLRASRPLKCLARAKLTGTGDQGQVGAIGGSRPEYWMHSIIAAKENMSEM